MKKIMEVSIGGYNFALEDDAYYRLKDYLNRFEATIPDKQEAKEVMEDVEARVAEIFQKEKKYPEQVIDLKIVKEVIELLGEVDPKTSDSEGIFDDSEPVKITKRLYRDSDNKKIAGVCSGIAAFFSIDTTLVRILFFFLAFVGSSTLWIYIILWIVTKPAKTVIQKLEMRGIPVTAENIRKYSTGNK